MLSRVRDRLDGLLGGGAALHDRGHFGAAVERDGGHARHVALVRNLPHEDLVELDGATGRPGLAAVVVVRVDLDAYDAVVEQARNPPLR